MPKDAETPPTSSRGRGKNSDFLSLIACEEVSNACAYNITTHERLLNIIQKEGSDDTYKFIIDSLYTADAKKDLDILFDLSTQERGAEKIRIFTSENTRENLQAHNIDQAFFDRILLEQPPEIAKLLISKAPPEALLHSLKNGKDKALSDTLVTLLKDNDGVEKIDKLFSENTINFKLSNFIERKTLFSVFKNSSLKEADLFLSDEAETTYRSGVISPTFFSEIIKKDGFDKASLLISPEAHAFYGNSDIKLSVKESRRDQLLAIIQSNDGLEKASIAVSPEMIACYDNPDTPETRTYATTEALKRDVIDWTTKETERSSAERGSGRIR